jgi:hypothetical protein
MKDNIQYNYMLLGNCYFDIIIEIFILLEDFSQHDC